MASNRSSSSSLIVSMTIFALGTSSLSARHASMPLLRGMRISMRITSGRDSPALLHGLFAVARLTHELDVGLGIEDHFQASPKERMVVDDQRAYRFRSRPGVSISVARPGIAVHAILL